ncbi:hypothetical protein ILUMI_02486 [Ignelater luminosus]|uniref:Cysteine protease n=1 Tax=Ignelater luminosus TaxID=2038154 RepID=A0A8K0GLB0_IGNLU|nr:hypothetical protein ILUMI_02486 [Ignelater luminosus]
MEGMFETYLTDGSLEVDDIPQQTKEPVWILGKKYNAVQELSMIRQDVLARLWFTYRKGFIPIGGEDGLTTDKGWGCMLRCGQMVLAQALISLHLGRDWSWEPETRDTTYLKILQKFEDRRQAPFSIHQIALMGASEGKEVGQWFGPNTVAQVLKKLIIYDDWSCVTIHVALDNTLIVNEIKKQCLSEEINSTNLLNIDWKPLLLVVPLRLGLSEINPIYTRGLQTCFKFSQSLGVIGGKPNLALYFIGCVGDEVIFLDPHTTQRAGFVENKDTEDQIDLDMTYHCKRASRINILSMDPSVALCFFCKTEEEFDDLCDHIRNEIIAAEKQPLFEICFDRPKEWSPTEDSAEDALAAACSTEFDYVERQYDSENEFEIL